MSTNVHWHEGEITRAHRQHMLGQKGATIWFTGLSGILSTPSYHERYNKAHLGCGKSTLAVALESELAAQGKLSYRLDGDNIRLGINSNLGGYVIYI